MTDNRVGEGNITFTLEDGEEMTLKPSWGAAQAISRQYGGVQAAVERIVRMDFDATIQVMLLGLGYFGSRKPPTDLAERIWRTGFTDRSGAIGETAIKYLHILANGGRALPDEAEGDAGGGGAVNPSMKEISNAT
jgi:hypothetical protein